MPLFQLVAVLIVVGVLLGLINRYIPMAGSIKSIMYSAFWTPFGRYGLGGAESSSA